MPLEVVPYDRGPAPTIALDDAIELAEEAALPLTSSARRYANYHRVLATIRRLTEEEPSFRLLRYGRSVENEPLFAIEIGDAGSRARTAVVLSGVHPNEWIGVE